jgi:high-affinity K+ transport system ATPase subunit B
VLKRSAALTITYLLGLLTIVPYSLWHVLHNAPREQYAVWLFVAIWWTFLFPPTIGALLTAVTVMRVMRNINRHRTLTTLIRASGLTGDDLIALVARNIAIPKFVARILVRRIQRLLPFSARATRT